MTVTPSISILNVIVAEIENKSMTILISLSSKQNGKKMLKQRPCWILEQEGSSLTRTLYCKMISGHINWENPSLFTM